MAKDPSPEFLKLRTFVENIVPDDATPAERIGKYRSLALAVVVAACTSKEGQAYVERGWYEAEAYLDLVASGGLGDVL